MQQCAKNGGRSNAIARTLSSRMHDIANSCSSMCCRSTFFHSVICPGRGKDSTTPVAGSIIPECPIPIPRIVFQIVSFGMPHSFITLCIAVKVLSKTLSRPSERLDFPEAKAALSEPPERSPRESLKTYTDKHSDVAKL